MNFKFRPLTPDVSNSYLYLQGVVVLLPDLLILFFQVLKVLLPHSVIQELGALGQTGKQAGENTLRL